jgi:hypothetical protein
MEIKCGFPGNFYLRNADLLISLLETIKVATKSSK